MWKAIVGIFLILVSFVTIYVDQFQTHIVKGPTMIPPALIIGIVGSIFTVSYIKEKVKENRDRKEREQKWSEERKIREQQGREKKELEKREKMKTDMQYNTMKSFYDKKGISIIYNYVELKNNTENINTKIEDFLGFYWHTVYFLRDYEKIADFEHILNEQNYCYIGDKYPKTDVHSILADDACRKKFFNENYNSYYSRDERRSIIDGIKSKYINIWYTNKKNYISWGWEEITKQVDYDLEVYAETYWLYVFHHQDFSAAREFLDLAIKQDTLYTGNKYQNRSEYPSPIRISDIMIDSNCKEKYKSESSHY